MQKIFTIFLVLVLALTFTAWESSSVFADSSSVSTQTSSTTSDSALEPQVLSVALAIPIAKIQYLDENGNFQGYDYETLVKIDELLPQYDFEYEPLSDFPSAFAGLDTKKFDFINIHAGWTEEREQKYLYGTVSFFENTGYNVIIKKGSDITVNGIEDLAGLKLLVPPGVSYQATLEKFNQENPDKQIEIVFFSGGYEQLLADVQSGAVDGTIGSPLTNTLLKEAYGDVFDETGKNLFYDPTKKNGTYFLFRYGDEQLRDDIDSALQKLLDDGTLSELSQEFFGFDGTLKPDVAP